MTHTIRMLIDHLATPIGRLALLADEQGRLRAVGFTDGHDRHDRHDRHDWMEKQLREHRRGQPAHRLVAAANPGGLTAALRAYFEGDVEALVGLPVEVGGTPFQRAVWGALRDIPYGETRSYGDIARQIGNPAAVRAVGLANGANPVGIVVPCHRVIGANGTLTGYAGGIARKRWLLAHEQREQWIDHRRALSS